MSKEFWMSKDAGCLANEEITYDTTSRIESKRPHQWFTDAGEAEPFPNKKQALHISSSNSFVQVPASNLSPWGNLSGFHSVPSQVTERFFDTEATRSINFVDRNFACASDGNGNMGRKVVNDPFGGSSSFSLSVSQSLEDPKSSINYNGIRKVKVSEVRDYENMPISMGSSYGNEDSNVISKDHDFDKVDDSDRSLGLRYGRENSVITAGDVYAREDDGFMSMGQSFNRGDGDVMAMGHTYKAENNNINVANSLGKGDGNILSMAESFSEGDNNVISIENFSRGDDNVMAISQAYRGGDDSIPLCNYNQRDDSTTSTAQLNNGGDHSLSMRHSFDKGVSNMISFGGYNNEEDARISGGLICSYDLLISQPSGPKPDTLNQNGLVVSDANALLSSVQILASGAEKSSRKKEDQKSTNKPPPNNFPSNVRSLLSTGILDEVPVKYIAWSREKELRAVIKGTGYLCGCQSCNFSKVINAYEFERHAGCKTKHPNNHIYFENGKTIYGIVQELRSTPQNMLFDVIQTITGSPINQKSFRLWKESFLAATRELQRIYGKDERNQLVQSNIY